jgi:stearoyl-CoA desaturase (Delta-9 desaturase)
MAFLTHGEGYHNFHHKFQIDFRNGIKWYHWDPTKWFIQILALMGQAEKLKKAPTAEIIKARLLVEEKLLLAKGVPSERIQELKEKIIAAQTRLKKLRDDYEALKVAAGERHDQRVLAFRMKIAEIKKEMKISKLEAETALQQWSLYLHSFEMA